MKEDRARKLRAERDAALSSLSRAKAEIRRLHALILELDADVRYCEGVSVANWSSHALRDQVGAIVNAPPVEFPIEGTTT